MSVPPPVILAVDDEPEVLNAVQRDLLRRYASDYRVIAANSGAEALEVVQSLAVAGDGLALIVADQRMPQITGVDVIKEALHSFPEVKRTLLTAYADTDAAISAINEVGLDHYIMKPWDPPEDLLFPILDDLLEDWQASYQPEFRGIQVVAQEWSKEAFDLRVFLARNQIPYRFVPLESGTAATQLLEASGATVDEVPVLCFPDGGVLTKPTEREIADHIGLRSQATGTTYDVAIVGAGPAGLAAAVYGASEGLSTVLIESSAPGGQAGESSLIENYLGFPRGISGADLARRAASQATRLGAEILVPTEVIRVERKDPYKVLHLSDGSSIATKSLIVASGVSYRRLQTEGLNELIGAGVYYGISHFEAETHRGENVFVVGGGNSAGQAALFLSRFANEVTILIRRDSLAETMSQYLIDNIAANPTVTVSTRSQILSATGEGRLESLRIEDIDSGEAADMEAGALFIFIGQEPRTEWLEDMVAKDEDGFILTGDGVRSSPTWDVGRAPTPLETSVPGIFAAGDVRSGSIRRVAGATGEGATAIRFVHAHLADL